jgi:hypothetical protein
MLAKEQRKQLQNDLKIYSLIDHYYYHLPYLMDNPSKIINIDLLDSMIKESTAYKHKDELNELIEFFIMFEKIPFEKKRKFFKSGKVKKDEMYEFFIKQYNENNKIYTQEEILNNKADLKNNNIEIIEINNNDNNIEITPINNIDDKVDTYIMVKYNVEKLKQDMNIEIEKIKEKYKLLIKEELKKIEDEALNF